jgi:hypothetical protein
VEAMTLKRKQADKPSAVIEEEVEEIEVDTKEEIMLTVIMKRTNSMIIEATEEESEETEVDSEETEVLLEETEEPLEVIGEVSEETEAATEEWNKEE